MAHGSADASATALGGGTALPSHFALSADRRDTSKEWLRPLRSALLRLLRMALLSCDAQPRPEGAGRVWVGWRCHRV
jgi:hypothetical protein